MRKTRLKTYFTFLFLIILLGFTDQDIPNYVSPTDIEISPTGEILYVAEKTGNKVKSIDISKKKELLSFSTELPPKAIKLFKNNLFVVTSYSKGILLVADKETMKVNHVIDVGKGACDIAINPVNKKAYVANQFSNNISVVDLVSMKEKKRISVLRQPKALGISRDGKYLFVANFLTTGRADTDTVTSEVSVIDLASELKIKDIPLANGSNALRGLNVSADGKYVFISHNLGRFQVPTSQIENGWINTSGLSIIDAEKLEYIATVLLDESDRGAAGSWGIDSDDNSIVVAHSGTHDFSVIDYKAFINRLLNYQKKDELSYNLRFLAGIRKRIPVQGNGPRALIIKNNSVYVANYFSDNINIIDIAQEEVSHKKIILNASRFVDSTRLGEMYFHDASFCFQQWQSCTGCHPDNARVDGLNWDLLNDGIGNSKNCKSMLLAHVTPPSMISGIRPSAEVAVAAGFKYIQFVEVGDGHINAVNKYLKSLKPIPSPFLDNGKLSRKAEKGKKLFSKLSCQKCHSPPYFTNMKTYEIGKQGEYDHQNRWDTPSLVEVWRTGPYLHDGRCATMKEVFKVEKHGLHIKISDKEIDHLVEYVLSL